MNSISVSECILLSWKEEQIKLHPILVVTQKHSRTGEKKTTKHVKLMMGVLGAGGTRI